MSVKEIDDDNATRGNVYTIHTTQIHTNTPHLETKNNKHEGKKMRDKYGNAYIQAVAIEFSRRRERMFCRLKACVYKMARQSGQVSVVIQLALSEVACGLKFCAI